MAVNQFLISLIPCWRIPADRIALRSDVSHVEYGTVGGFAVTQASTTAARPPVLSGLAAATAGLFIKLVLGQKLPLVPFLVVGVGTFGGIYAFVLLIAMNQKRVYLDLLSSLLPNLQPKKESTTSPETARAEGV